MTHPEITPLLPWYLNGTLAETERRAVADHLRECAECTRELGSLEDLQAAVRDAAQQAPEPSPLLLTRALASIDEYEREKEAAGWPWLAWWRPLPKFARVALAVQLAAIVGLGSYIAVSRDRPRFETAGSSIPGAHADRVQIAVMFQPGASEAQIRQVLQGLGASIIGGPSALGVYTIELPIARDDAEPLARALKSLRESREVVRFAEQAQ